MNVSKTKVLKYFFGRDNVVFSVPYYQRYYVWKKDNCEELYHDICEAQDKKKQHFLGTIVLKPSPQTKIGDTAINNSSIIDGQQRIATIYILLKALYDLAELDETKSKLKALLFNTFESVDYSVPGRNYKLKDIDQKGEESPLYKLMQCECTDDFKNLPTEVLSSDIYKNYLAFKNFIKKTADAANAQLDTVVTYVLSGIGRLEMALISLGKKDKPQVVFERINSTGVTLGLDDLVRNYLLMDAVGTKSYEKWGILEGILTYENKSYVRDFLESYIVYRCSSLDEKNSYRSFKNIVSNSMFEDNCEKVLDDLITTAKYYAFLNFHESNYDSNYSKEAKNIINSILRLDQKTIHPFLFQILNDYENEENESITRDNHVLEDVLFFFLNYLVRRSILNVPTNTLRTFFKGLYDKIFPDVNEVPKSDPQKYLHRVYQAMAEEKRKNAVPSNNKEIRDSLCDKKMNLYEYKKGNLCRFLFDVFENSDPSLGIVTSDKWTIEHIMPQNIKGTAWEGTIDSNDFPDYINRIGNLSLATQECNSKFSNRPFDEKKEQYKKLKTHNLYEYVLSCNQWNTTEIEKRGEIISQKLIDDIFKLPDEFEELLENVRPELYEVEEHSLDETDVDYTNINLISVSICDERPIEVKKMSELKIKVCEYLYNHYPEIVESLASSGEVSAGKVYFSYDANLKESAQPHMLGDSGIYVDTHANGNDNIRSLVQILDYFDEISSDDIVVMFKRKK